MNSHINLHFFSQFYRYILLLTYSFCLCILQNVYAKCKSV